MVLPSPHNDRAKIMHRLERAVTKSRDADLTHHSPDVPTWSLAEKIDRLQGLLEAVKSEVHRVTADNWVARLGELARTKNIQNLLYGPRSPLSPALEAASSDLPELLPYSEDIETFKEKLFQVDAGVTSTIGAVADTGAIALWPTTEEPRTISLVPPIHFAIVMAETIYASMSEIMARQDWVAQMPANALFISGPSKTADIEFTLAFGVHGPKELVVLIVES